MAIRSSSMLSDGIKKLDEYTKKPEKFLGIQADVAEDIKQFVKELYDFTKRSEKIVQKKTEISLPELIIKDFDEEQIWQELELQNDGRCNQFIVDISLLVARKDNLKFPIKLKCHNSNVFGNPMKTKLDCSVSDSVVECDEGELDIEEEGEEDKEYKNTDPENELKALRKHKGHGKVKSSIVDDVFFKLHDLEKYLDSEDKKENKLQKKNFLKIKDDDEDSDDNESIDYFEEIQSEDTDEEEEEVEQRGRDLHYADFFDDPDATESGRKSRKRKITTEASDEVEEQEEEEDDEMNEGAEEDGVEKEGLEDYSEGKHVKDGEKQVRFDLSPASSDSASSDMDDDGDENKNIKSSFEARQERLKSRINSLEEEALSEKPWQLKGEVSSTARPQNSLLEEIVEFDLTTRPAPVITEQTTMRLEDIIQQRIKDKAWDDVERKVKPVQTPNEYRKQLVMDQEKSKLSLAQVYEQEFIKQREALNPENQDRPEEEPKEHQEVRAMMSTLFAKLDALSNFHYTPKPVAPEVKVISNLPAINMEEVAPVATSDATLLAPEEVKAKPKGDLMGKSERTKTDMKRERRHKKAMQRYHKMEKEKREKAVQKLRPGLGNKYSKERALQMLEKVTKDKNVEQMEDMGHDKGVKSSSAFFARLQEEVTSHIKSKTQTSKRKKEKSLSAKKMKL